MLPLRGDLLILETLFTAPPNSDEPLMQPINGEINLSARLIEPFGSAISQKANVMLARFKVNSQTSHVIVIDSV